MLGWNRFMRLLCECAVLWYACLCECMTTVCICLCPYVCAPRVEGRRQSRALQCSRTAILSCGNFPWDKKQVKASKWGREGWREAQRRASVEAGKRGERGSEPLCQGIMRNDTVVAEKRPVDSPNQMHTHCINSSSRLNIAPLIFNTLT